MKWVIYNLLFLIVYPFLLPGFLLRMLRRGGYKARMGDRFALYPESLHSAPGTKHSALIWIHAVSVGEVQVAGQLMREWRAQDPEVKFLFSTTSSTGWKMAEREVTEKDVLIYNPLDFPTFVKAALKFWEPKAIILTESEIWPNFILQAKKAKIPTFLINARVSDRSAPRYEKAKFFFSDVLNSFDKVFAQSELDASRLKAAGLKDEKIEVTGSFKFDVARRNPTKESELENWIFGVRGEGQGEGQGRAKILLGGSTWPGEDEVLLKIYKTLCTKHSAQSTKLVLAPRHFEKADQVEANIKAAGFECIRRSRGDTLGTQHSALGTSPVYLADTTGELMGLYGISEVVFVGKSLCEHGSQNMIEPCLCGKPTLVGPYTENFRPVMSDLLEGEGIIQVKDAAELEKEILRLFENPGDLGEKAFKAVERRKGVVPKCVKAIRESI